MIIDAHQHFWDPADDPYPWMTGPLRRVFAPADLRPELDRAGVAATVLVQTRPSLAETEAFLSLAARTSWIAGVVGWVDLTDPGCGDTLARLMTPGAKLVGVRHQVHDEPDADWLRRPDVRRGLMAVQAHGLAYDLLLRPREIPAALDTVAAFPELRFVVDHLAKPEIALGRHGDWAALMAGFQRHRGHVWCKLSGMVTEAGAAWRPESLAPYIRTALDLFGAERCLFGSDWPVCLLAASYGQTLDALCDALHGAERDQVLARSAIELYRLPHPA